MSRKNDKPPHVEAVRKRLEEAAKERPEPRFGGRRTRKPRRPADEPTVQRSFLFDGEVQECPPKPARRPKSTAPFAI